MRRGEKWREGDGKRQEERGREKKIRHNRKETTSRKSY